MEFCFWFIIIFALVYEPIVGYFAFQKFKVAVRKNGNARLKFYKNTILGLWVPTAFILLLVIFTELTLKDIGLLAPSINLDTLGVFVTASVFVAALVYLISTLYYFIGYHVSEKIKAKWMEAKQKGMEQASIEVMLPVTKQEKKAWNYVSLTAGITEEIIYRGFLIYAFSYLFPDLSIWLVLLLSSVLFGLAHSYQGFAAGILRTTFIGFIFAILYIGLGSIWPIIVLHFLIDYVAKLGDAKE